MCLPADYGIFKIADFMAERNFIMDVFRIRSSYRVSLKINFFFPLLIFCTPVALILILGRYVTDSYLFIFAAMIIAGLVWLFFDIRNSVRASRFRVSLSEDSIRVGDVEKKWTEIQSVEYLKVAGMMKPVIVLHAGEDLKIPAATDGLPYIRAYIEKHVGTVVRKDS